MADRPPMALTLKRSHARYLRYALWFGAVLVLLLALRRRSSGPELGHVAPDFALPIVDGTDQRFHLAEARGTPVVIEVFASWCGSCQRIAPVLTEAAQATRARTVRFLGVSVDDSAERASSVKRSWNIPYDVVLDDGSFSRSFAITLLPTIVVVDEDGKVRHVTSGGIERERLEEWLADVGAPLRSN